MSLPLLCASQLSKSFGNFTPLKPLNLKLNTGITLLLGENGAGKSLLMAILAGVMPPSSGQVIIDKTIATTYRQPIGYASDRLAFWPHYKVAEALILQASLTGHPSPQQQAAKLLSQCHLEKVANIALKKLSLGYQQRLNMALALCGDSPIILLDELSNGLDPLEQRNFIQLIQQLKEEGRTLLIASHSLEEANELAGHLLIIKQGKLLYNDNLPQHNLKELYYELHHAI